MDLLRATSRGAFPLKLTTNDLEICLRTIFRCHISIDMTLEAILI